MKSIFAFLIFVCFFCDVTGQSSFGTDAPNITYSGGNVSTFVSEDSTTTTPPLFDGLNLSSSLPLATSTSRGDRLTTDDLSTNRSSMNPTTMNMNALNGGSTTKVMNTSVSVNQTATTNLASNFGTTTTSTSATTKQRLKKIRNSTRSSYSRGEIPDYYEYEYDPNADNTDPNNCNYQNNNNNNNCRRWAWLWIIISIIAFIIFWVIVFVVLRCLCGICLTSIISDAIRSNRSQVNPYDNKMYGTQAYAPPPPVYTMTPTRPMTTGYVGIIMTQDGLRHPGRNYF